MYLLLCVTFPGMCALVLAATANQIDPLDNEDNSSIPNVQHGKHHHRHDTELSDTPQQQNGILVQCDVTPSN